MCILWKYQTRGKMVAPSIQHVPSSSPPTLQRMHPAALPTHASAHPYPAHPPQAHMSGSSPTGSRSAKRPVGGLLPHVDRGSEQWAACACACLSQGWCTRGPGLGPQTPPSHPREGVRRCAGPVQGPEHGQQGCHNRVCWTTKPASAQLGGTGRHLSRDSWNKLPTAQLS